MAKPDKAEFPRLLPRQMFRAVEPQSATTTPAKPTAIKPSATKRGPDTPDCRDFAQPDAKPYADDPQNIAFRAGLKRLRMSAARFAELADASPKTVEGWLQGIARPSGSAMRLLGLIDAVPEARAWLEAQHPKPKPKPRGKPFTKATR